MSAGGDELDAGQVAGDQKVREGQPARAVLGGGDVQAQQFAVSIGVDADGDQGVAAYDAAAFADLLCQCVDQTNRYGPKAATRSSRCSAIALT